MAYDTSTGTYTSDNPDGYDDPLNYGTDYGTAGNDFGSHDDWDGTGTYDVPATGYEGDSIAMDMPTDQDMESNSNIRVDAPTIIDRSSMIVDKPDAYESKTEAESWWEKNVIFSSVKNFLGYGDPNSDAAVEAKAMQEAKQYYVGRMADKDLSPQERAAAVETVSRMNAAERESKAGMADVWQMAQITFGGLAAYFSYLANKRSEKEADKSPEEKGEETAREKYAASKKYTELYDADNPDTGGDEAVAVPIVTYKPGTISGRI